MRINLKYSCAAMLEFEDVYKTYGQQPVIRIESLKLNAGIYWLQGINGSGKTTFLRMLAGMIPFNGEIRLNKTNLRKEPLSYRRLVNFAEAEPLYPDFITGSELIRFFQDVRKADSTQRDMLIYLFKMKDFVTAPVKTYSSGMIKKLSLLLAFIGKPALILLDEPLATLDEGSINIIPELISTYHREFRTSFIFSSHQMFRSNSLVVNNILISDQSLRCIA
jgi:ABC-2 type transport system ATP-binding protein